MWSSIGMSTATALVLLALWRSRRAPGYYDETYGMHATAHRRYAWIAMAFFIFFAFDHFRFGDAGGSFAFGIFVVVAIFYLSSFLRGAVHEDE